MDWKTHLTAFKKGDKVRPIGDNASYYSFDGEYSGKAWSRNETATVGKVFGDGRFMLACDIGSDCYHLIEEWEKVEE